MNRERKKVLYGPKAADQIRELDPQIRSQVGKAVKRLEKAPELGKPLKNKENLYSYRFGTPGGEYRAIYRIKEESVLVVLVGPRKEIYEILRRSNY
ncbi:type II toxin-antitoxin system RelE/ParE family toxin [Candidatus Bipolaricaulota bacterium]|nr:type II toxin-antitoxin system RelE/ParE family toxin [Candidatus Bipolaricaulota bacterium]